MKRSWDRLSKFVAHELQQEWSRDPTGNYTVHVTVGWPAWTVMHLLDGTDDAHLCAHHPYAVRARELPILGMVGFEYRRVSDIPGLAPCPYAYGEGGRRGRFSYDIHIEKNLSAP